MTIGQFYKIYDGKIETALRAALKEDNILNDITSNTIFNSNSSHKKISAKLLCKQDCILAGSLIFRKVYRIIDPGAGFRSYFNDGDYVRNKETVLEVKSSLKNLLIGERTALNFVQKMSGIAALTDYFVKKLKYKGSKILHTRKTTPNFRLFETAAVKTGGGDFHRLSLQSAVMIKDNHLVSAGSVENALKIFRTKKKKYRRFEIEAKSIEEVKQIITYGKGLVEIVMLDNFKESELNKAVRLLKKGGFKIELSGGINKSNFGRIQRKGIDYYSIGMLTHSYRSADFSLEF